MVMDPGEPFEMDRAEKTIEQSKSDPSDALCYLRPRILAMLQQPKSRDEVATELNVIKGQADQWLARLVAEGTVIKHTRPARYVANE